MEKKVEIKRECVESLFETKFVNLYDLQYAEGKHYFDATRRDANHLLATMTDEEFRREIPDAVSCSVVLEIEGEEPKLYLMKEYRYPVGRFVLSVPAGLVDGRDENVGNPVFHTAIREIKEETGIEFDENTDEIKLVNPMLLASPGFTDESTAFVKIILHRDKQPELSQDGAEGSELFDGATWVTKEEAREILRRGRDDKGIYYSAITWIGLMTFVSDIW